MRVRRIPGLRISLTAWSIRRIQPVVATLPILTFARNWSIASAGVFQPSVLRGLVLIVWATASSSSEVCWLEIGALRKVLPQQSIRVFVRTALPRTLRITEVNL